MDRHSATRRPRLGQTAAVPITARAIWELQLAMGRRRVSRKETLSKVRRTGMLIVMPLVPKR
jgi:hypothetical protein